MGIACVVQQSGGSRTQKKLVVLEVTLSPTGGHNFHKHPQQEEVIYVIEGEIEQWLDGKSEHSGRGIRFSYART